MKGVILGYDIASATGVIRGEDENRYSFDRRHWRSPQQPVAGAQVDFVASGQSAEEIYTTASGGGLQFSGDFSNLVSGIAIRPSLVLAAAILIGCFLPLFSFSALIAAAGPLHLLGAQLAALPTEPSLIGLPDLWSRLIGFSRRYGGESEDPIGLWIWLPYLIPLLAGALLMTELRNREGDTRVLQGGLGICAFVLPVGVYFLWVLPALANANGAPQSIPWGVGAFLIAGGGFFLLLNIFGVFKRWQPGATASEHYQPPQPAPYSPPQPSARSAQASLAVDAPATQYSGSVPESSYGPSDEPLPRTGLPTAAWAAIALIVIGALGGAGFFGWRYYQEQQAAAAVDAAWAALSQTDPAALRAFLAGAPGEHRAEAEQVLTQLDRRRYADAQFTDTPEAFETFLADFPQSVNAAAARGRIAELQGFAALTEPLLGAWAGAVNVDGATQSQLLLTIAIEGRALRGRFELVGSCAGLWDGGEDSARRGSPWAFKVSMVAGQCDAALQITLTQLPDGTLAVAYFDPARGEVVASGTLTRALAPTTP